MPIGLFAITYQLSAQINLTPLQHFGFSAVVLGATLVHGLFYLNRLRVAGIPPWLCSVLCNPSLLP